MPSQYNGPMGIFEGYMEYCQKCGQYNPEDKKCDKAICPYNLDIETQFAEDVAG